MSISLPSFTCASSAGDLQLNQLDSTYLVLYFYPKDNTPGCTTESKDFRDHYPQFQQLDLTIIGVSRDSLKSHDKFIEKQNLPFPLIADTDEKLCRHFDVIQLKKFMGREFMGIERSTFLFQQGKLLKEWRKVKVKGHAVEVLNTIKEDFKTPSTDVS